MKHITFKQFKNKAVAAAQSLKGKAGAVVAGAGAATLLAQNAMAVDYTALETATDAQSTAMVTSIGNISPGLLGIVGGIVIVMIIYRMLKGSK